MINLDTHILIDAVLGQLRPGEERALEDFWCVSDIVLWEIVRLRLDGRIRIRLDDPELSRVLRSMTIWPISRHVAEAIGSLDFRSDPADEIIAATSIAHEVPLLTRDARILASKTVPFAISG
jgi:predicted nucleic acid-binding protein